MTPELSAAIVHLWQSTIFAGIVWLAALALRANNARVRYWLWTAASLKFFVPFSWLVGICTAFQWQSAPPMVKPAAAFVIEQVLAPAAFAPVPALAVAPAISTFALLPWMLALMWLAGTAAVLTWWWRHWRIVRTALRSAVPVELSPSCDTTGILVVTSPLALEPGVVGIRRPVLLLPEGLAERLTPGQLNSLVGHERCHIRCHDNLVALLHMLVEAVFWFHPLVWWIENRMIAERERACDEAVLRSGSDPQDYAEGLLEVCRSSMASPLACVAGVTGSNLRRRVEQILRNETGRPMTAAGRLALALIGVSCLTIPVLAGLVAAEIPLVAVAQTVAVQPDLDPVVQPGIDLRDRKVSSASGPEEYSGKARASGESSRAVRPAEATRQDVAQGRTFDVVSIKRNLTLDPNTAVAQVQTVRNRVFAPSATLRDLVRAAYNYQFRPVSLIIGGPAWVDTERYEVIGQTTVSFGPAPGRGLLPEEANEMLRAMLADRFQFKMHFEMRERSVYELVIDREDGQLGPALTAAKGDCQSSMGTPDLTIAITVPPCPFLLGWYPDGTTVYEMRNITLPELASTLGNYPSINELVVDRTGLTGRFDMRIKSFEQHPQGSVPATRELPPPTDIAIRQQLGLRLRRARLPVEAIVIDSVARPTEN